MKHEKTFSGASVGVGWHKGGSVALEKRSVRNYPNELKNRRVSLKINFDVIAYRAMRMALEWKVSEDNRRIASIRSRINGACGRQGVQLNVSPQPMA